MAQVRETIELLTKLLRRNGTSKMKAEMFRLAKFNSDEAAGPFWKLLFELLYFLKYGVIDDVTIKAYSELTQEELAVYVKKSMQSRGFYSKEFSLLPNDMTSGSRELLLAFAWLMCKENVIVKFMEHCSSPVDDNTLSVYEFDLEENIHSHYLTCSQSLNPVQKVQHLQLLNGKMRSSLKRLYGLQREKVKLDHKVRECTQGVSLSPGLSHLTALEVHMLKHPELLKKVFHLLEKDNERLQILLVWTEQEEKFWKWMESVLDLKMQEMSVSGGVAKLLYYNIAPDCMSGMETARLQLEEAIVKYESIIEQLEDVWESKRTTVTEQELDNLLTSINMEISLQQANLALDNTEQVLRKYKDPGLFYQRNSTSSSKKVSNLQVSGHVRELSGQGDSPDPPTDIRSEISVLEAQLKRLELESRSKRSHYCSDLDTISSSIPDSICIQPKGYR